MGIRYIVLDVPPDRELQVGDRFKIDDEGFLICNEAGGWIEAEYVEAVLKDVTYKLDVDWYVNRLRGLKIETLQIKNLLEDQSKVYRGLQK